MPSKSEEENTGVIHSDEHWMKAALQLAKKAEDSGEVPVGALIISNNEILAEGYNQPIAARDATAHAEIMAIRNAGLARENYRIPDTTLYVTLEPCAMCAGAIIHARISRVVFAAFDPRTGAAGSVYELLQDSQHNHRVEVTSGVMEDASAEMLRAFFRSRRKSRSPSTVTDGE